MTEVVTGGAGFIGSHLVRRLLRAGHVVHVVDDLSRGTRENLADVLGDPRLHVAVMDVTGADFPAWLQDVSPTRVHHLAANADVQLASVDRQADVRRTLLTTVSVLEAMRRCRCRELVFTSSSTVYGELDGMEDGEHGALRPISVYGAAKLSSEAYISAYAHLDGIRAWIFRLPNVVGPNLTHGVVRDFVRRLKEAPGRLRVLGNGAQTRSYLHVEDALDAMVMALGQPPGTWNIAGEGSTSVAQVAELVRDALGAAVAIEYGESERGWPGDVRCAVMDATRIRALGWRPRMSSVEALREAIRWEIGRRG